MRPAADSRGSSSRTIRHRARLPGGSHSSDMDIGVGVDTANNSIGVSYDGHCHPSLHRRAGVARTCRTGGPGRRPGVNRTGTPTSHPTVECRSRSQVGGSFERQPSRVSAGSRVRPTPGTNQPYGEAEGDSPHETVSAPKPILPAGYGAGLAGRAPSSGDRLVAAVAAVGYGSNGATWNQPCPM